MSPLKSAGPHRKPRSEVRKCRKVRHFFFVIPILNIFVVHYSYKNFVHAWDNEHGGLDACFVCVCVFFFNLFTASCENTMSLSVPGVPAPYEKFPHKVNNF
jgi:hypothetical protein